MGEEKKEKVNGKKVSRRGFLKGAAVAAGTAGLVGFPAVMRVSAQARHQNEDADGLGCGHHRLR